MQKCTDVVKEYMFVLTDQYNTSEESVIAVLIMYSLSICRMLMLQWLHYS